MSMPIKKIVSFVILLSIPIVASALDYTLLEPVTGFLPPEAPSLDVYLAGLFRLIIGIAGILAVIRITWCGFNLMMSVSPSAREDAKECIKMSLFGLLLALGAFLIINSLRVGPDGGIAIGNPFVLPETGTRDDYAPGEFGPGLPGSPVCEVVSSNITLLEGQSTNVSALCAPDATDYFWIPSPGSPMIQGDGGLLTFSRAGVYTYRVRGQNAIGLGNPSALITITVTLNPVGICPEVAPTEVVGAIGCAQTNTVLNWSTVGAGNKEENIDMGNGKSVSITFTSGPAGAYGTFQTLGIVDPTTKLPINVNADKFVNISKAQCDFRYDNIDKGACAVAGKNVTLRFQSGMGRPPTGIPGCVLEPNTAYFINVRNEEAGGPLANRTVDTCPTLGTCEFTAKMTQSEGAQFTPPERVQCTPPRPITGTPPTFEITSPSDSAVVGSGELLIGFRAQDVGTISSIRFSVVNAETGAVLSIKIACTLSGSPATGGAPAIPACGSVTESSITMIIPSVQGIYRIEGTVCGTTGRCVRKSVTVTVAFECTPTNTLRCYTLPNSPISAEGRACVPGYEGGAITASQCAPTTPTPGPTPSPTPAPAPVPGPTPPPYTGSAKLMYQNDFESGWGDVLFTGFCPQRGGESQTLFVSSGDSIPAGHEQFALTTAQARKGTHSARTILDPRYACYDNIGRFKLRSEIYMTKSWGSGYRFVDNVDHWYGISILVDASNSLANPPYTIMTQIRPGSGISNALKNTNGNWDYYFEGVSGGQSTGMLGAIEKGRWTDFVFHLRPSQNGNGVVEIWINGVKKYSRTGLDYTSTNRDGETAFAHSGVYYGTYGENYAKYGDRNLPFVAYIDSIRIAQGTDGYALVDPSQ